MLDYIVVGFGLAGLSFTQQLKKANKSFIVISKEEESSSVVAGGMYNPVILKRFTLPWESTAQLEYAIPFYKEIEVELKDNFLIPLPVYRRFANVEEQNNWLIASDKPDLENYLSTSFVENNNQDIDAPYNFGEVKKAGRLLVSKLLKSYSNNLLIDKSYLLDTFDYSHLEINDSHISYKGIKARHIVFTEGYGLKENPYFNYLPLNGTKGEVLTFECKGLSIDAIIKSGVFIIPQQEKDHYFVGATYNWTDKSWEGTPEGKEELETKLAEFFKAPYKIIEHKAGIRPTVKDRRPLLGQHPKSNRLWVFNGLGTRGVMVAPKMSQELFDCIEKNVPLRKEIDIKRFVDLYND